MTIDKANQNVAIKYYTGRNCRIDKTPKNRIQSPAVNFEIVAIKYFTARNCRIDKTPNNFLRYL